MIVIDSSAMIAILRLEDDAFLHAISHRRCESHAISAVETSVVLAGAAALWAPLDELLAKAAVEIVPFDGEHRRGMIASVGHQLVGRWRIVEADLWDRDYLDLVESAYIEIGTGGRGELAFGVVNAT
jgi:hypothetical protein